MKLILRSKCLQFTLIFKTMAVILRWECRASTFTSPGSEPQVCSLHLQKLEKVTLPLCVFSSPLKQTEVLCFKL